MERYVILFNLIQLQPKDVYVIKYGLQDFKSTFNNSQKYNKHVLSCYFYHDKYIAEKRKFHHHWADCGMINPFLIVLHHLGNHDPFINLMRHHKMAFVYLRGGIKFICTLKPVTPLGLRQSCSIEMCNVLMNEFVLMMCTITRNESILIITKQLIDIHKLHIYTAIFFIQSYYYKNLQRDSGL